MVVESRSLSEPGKDMKLCDHQKVAGVNADITMKTGEEQCAQI